ncbi:hypothetical protein B0J11DRAFT_513064 [Dendryphion nanum]|uniref:Uncharacterized protein n=1 Tax=Dendryphion nanum TaxID=256645 RepID=A0A9P9CXX0_9PLEO|nr:hypothetical protein B0J11DRAFT_513064 [Dendryphion nanum]
MSSGNPLKRPGGRPKKYSTAAAAAEAKKEIEFIAYEPPLSEDVPNTTSSNLNLRISADVPIPRDGDEPPNPEPNRERPPRYLLDNEDAEIVRRIEQIRENEEESNAEQYEYEAAIVQRLDDIDTRAAGSLIEMQLDKNRTHMATSKLQGGSANGESMPHALEGSLNLATEGQENDARLRHGVTESSGKQATGDDVRTGRLLQEPSQQSTASPPRLCRKNNPLSWIRPPPGSPSASSTLPRPRVAASSPFHPSIPSACPNHVPSGGGTASLRQNATASSTASPTASLEPPERTAIRLAKQLRDFHGCTLEEHDEADRLHQEHH